MKKTLLAAALVAVSLTAKAEISSNITVASDYRFRGISQTQKATAVQAGTEYGHASGAYVGAWASNVSTDFYPGGKGAEVDVYGGYRTEVAGVGVDVGVLRYNYPSTTADFDTNEVYVGVSKGPVSFKVSQSTTNYFGTAESKNTRYYDANVSVPVTKTLSVTAHAGYTDVANQSTNDYADYSIGFSNEIAKGVSVGVRYHRNELTADYAAANIVEGKDLAKQGVVASISVSF